MTLKTTWLLLLLLSALSTGFAFQLANGFIAQIPFGICILVLAWGKAFLIASRYLGLAAAPAFQQGFALCLAIYMLALLALYLMV